MSQTVEELHHQLLDKISKAIGGELDGYVSWLIIDDLVAAVIQAERRRILDNSLFQFGMGDGTYMMIRTSILNPGEVDNGN